MKLAGAWLALAATVAAPRSLHAFTTVTPLSLQSPLARSPTRTAASVEEEVASEKQKRFEEEVDASFSFR